MFGQTDAFLEDIKQLNIQGVICIDLWDKHPDWSDKGNYGIGLPSNEYLFSPRYKQWLAFMSGLLPRAQFQHIINSPFRSMLDVENDRSLYNTFRHYLWHQRNNPSILGKEILDSLVVDAHYHRMSSIMLSNVMNNEHSFSLRTAETFAKHVEELNLDIKNWLVVGQAWRMCVHNRPIGLHKLIEHIPEFNFYCADITTWNRLDRVCTVDDFTNDPTMQWDQVAGNIFKAVKTLDKNYPMPDARPVQAEDNPNQWYIVEVDSIDK